MVRLQFHSLVFHMTIFVVGIASDGKLSIKLVHFENRKSMLNDGTCCDGFESPGVCNLCENEFAICVSDVNMKPCSIFNYRTYSYLASEYILFESNFELRPYGEVISNPMEFTFSRWNGTIFFGITVYDEDGKKFDHIATMTQNITINATQFGTTVKTGVAMEGKRRSDVTPKLTAEISVHCMENYLIPSCEEYCVDTDDVTGHYKCNYTSGSRECLPGWFGDKCNNKIIHCTPRNDTQGHYLCDKVTGEKICLPGWKNVTRNCTEAIITQPTDSIQSTTIQQKYLSSSYSTTNQATSTSEPSTNKITSRGAKELISSTLQLTPVIKTSYMVTTANLQASAESPYLDTVFISTAQHIAITTPTPTTMLRVSSTNLHQPSLLSGWNAPPSSVQATSTYVATAITTSKVNTASVAEEFLKSSSSQLHITEKATMSRKLSASTTSRPVLTSLSSSRRAENVPPLFTSLATKEVKRTSSQPTIKTTQPKGNNKKFDFSKLMAIGLSTLVIVALLITVIAASIRKNRIHRVRPISLSERYKQNSARFTESRKSSFVSQSNTSAPSIRFFDERKAGYGPYMMHEYPSSSDRGFHEARVNSKVYVTKIEADNKSINSENRFYSLRTRESSGKNTQDGQETPKKYDQAESLHTKNELCHSTVASHPFLVLPLPRSKIQSL